MLDIIEKLPPGARVLDLGARTGSFSTPRTDLCVIRLDLDAPPAALAGVFVRADAARLPFPGQCFDAVVSNHSLEHFVELQDTVGEIGRVVKPDAVLYVAVPDADTLTDRVYRWLGKGGGHVNAFRSPAEVTSLIEKSTPLHHRSTTLLFSSFSFLNARNFTSPPPRKIALFAFGNECFLAWFTWILRGLDQAMGTRLSVYGWAFQFGGTAPGPAVAAWINVCVRCGSGASEAYLRQRNVVRRGPGGIERYSCPQCGAQNLLTPDRPAALP